MYMFAVFYYKPCADTTRLMGLFSTRKKAKEAEENFEARKDFLKNNTNYPPELLDEYIEAHHNYLLAKISERSHEDADQRKLAYDRLLIAKEQQKTINSQDAIIKNFQIIA